MGTHNYNWKDTDLASGVHAAIQLSNEDEQSDGTAALATETSGGVANGGSGFLFIFTTLGNNPNNGNWPNGTFTAQLSVNAAGANMSYGLTTAGTASGHFARVDSGLTSDLGTFQQTQALFTGTGTKTASQTSDQAAGAGGDRFECLIAGTNGATHTANQTVTLNLNDGSSFGQIPWAINTVTPSDTVTITETMSRQLTLGRSFADTVTITETMQAVKIFPRSAADSVVIAESAAVQQKLNRSFSDTVTVTETISVQKSTVKGVADTITLTDSITVTTIGGGAPVARSFYSHGAI